MSSKEIKVLVVRKTVSVNVEVAEVVGMDLFLKYNAGLCLEMAAKGVLIYFKEALSNFVEEKGQNTLVAHLDQIEKLRRVLSIINLNNISFNDNAAIISFELKT